MDKRRLLIASNLSVSLAGIALAWHGGCQGGPKEAGEFSKSQGVHEEGIAKSAPRPVPAPAPPPVQIQQHPGATPERAPEREVASVRETLMNVIERRVNQEKPKMKLTAGQGKLASAYVLEEFPSMPGCRELAGVMPKTAIELLRSVHERGVQRKDAEEMAEYLVSMHDSLRMANPAQLDENTSRVIGRNWSEIDYSGENMTSESQMKHYRNVPDFKTLPSLRSFFLQESRMPYFRKLYRPEGAAP